MIIYVIILFRSFSSNLHFHCYLLIISFNIIILQHLQCVYLQNFTQRQNTTAETTKNRARKAFVILFTLLSYKIS